MLDACVFYFIWGVCQWLLAVFAGRSGGVARCWREFFSLVWRDFWFVNCECDCDCVWNLGIEWGEDRAASTKKAGKQTRIDPTLPLGPLGIGCFKSRTKHIYHGTVRMRISNVIWYLALKSNTLCKIIQRWKLHMMLKIHLKSPTMDEL